MNNTNMPQSYQSSLVSGISQQPRQSQPPTATAHYSSARPATVNNTVTTYQRPASQAQQRRQLYQQQQVVIRQQTTTVVQTRTLAPAQVTAPATRRAAPTPALAPQARNNGWARAVNRRVHLDRRSTIPAALRARLAWLNVNVTLHYDRDGIVRSYSYPHDESILGPVNVWGGHGLFTI